MPVCRSWRREAQYRQSPIQPSPHSCTSQVAVNHLCETIWLPLIAPSTCSPRFNPFRPSLLSHPRAGNCYAAAAAASAATVHRPPTLPTRRCSLDPSRLLCPRAPLTSCQQRETSAPAPALALAIALALALVLCACTCTCICHSPSPTPACLRHFLECRRIRADVCVRSDEWRGPKSSRAQ